MVLARFTAKERLGGGARESLVLGPKGWVCSEGQRVVLRTRSARLPVVRSSGSEIAAKSLQQLEDAFVGEYEFLIDSWAGRMAIDLCVDGVVCDQLTLDIKPSENKLSGSEFDTMLDELATRSPSVIWGLSWGSGGGQETRDAPSVVHPIVIEALLPQFERLLSRFVADPPTVSRRQRELAPFELAKRSDVKTLRWLGQRPRMLAAIRHLGSDPTARRAPIDQPVSVLSLDHPVTRYFAYLLRRLIRRFSESSALLRRRSGLFADPTADAQAKVLADRLDAAAQRLQRVLAHRVFKGVDQGPPSETAVQAVADHPMYGAIQHLGRRLLQPGLGYDPSGNLEAALKRTYDLFEIFVLYRLLEQLPKSLGSEWQHQKVRQRSRRGREDRPANQASWSFVGPENRTLEVRYQQWFSRAISVDDTRPHGSLSGPNVPDYVLILRRAGEVESWVILDAKYRAGQQPVDQGLGDVHRYRDALRVRGQAAQGAFIVVPRLTSKKAIYSLAHYHETHRFGAIELFSQGWDTPIWQALGLSTTVSASSV